MRVLNNMVQLAGSLVNKPELRRLTDGTYVVHLRLRTYQTATKRNDADSERLTFNLKAYGNLAQELERSFRKNSQLMVRGELRNRLTIRNQQPTYLTEIQVFEFLALGKPKASKTPSIDHPFTA